MDPSYRVLVSSPKLKNLSREQQRFLGKFNEKVTSAGVRIVEMDEGLRLEDIASGIRQLQGLIAVAFGQWQGQRLTKKRDKVIFPTEFNHLHIAIAAAAGRPLLIVKEKSVSERGTLRPSLGCRTVQVPSSLDPAWLGGPEFEKQFESWLKEVKAQRDVFLGYCSKSKDTAAQIQLRIEKLGASVLNWAMDFRAGASILSEVEKARAACSCGVFLFSEDDPLEGAPGGAAPRDNVVFEAGYFISSKGPERCLIIRRGKAKMPADVGGAIYVHLGRLPTLAQLRGSLAISLRGISKAPWLRLEPTMNPPNRRWSLRMPSALSSKFERRYLEPTQTRMKMPGGKSSSRRDKAVALIQSTKLLSGADSRVIGPRT